MDLLEVLGALGGLYLALADYPRAAASSERCLAIAERLGGALDATGKYGVAVAWSNLGTVSFENNNWRESVKSFGKALDLFAALSKENPAHAVSVFNCLLEIALSQQELGDYREAARFWNRSIGVARQYALEGALQRALDGLGVLYLDQGDYAKALELLGECLKIAKNMQDKNAAVKALTSLGYVYERQGEYEQALRNFDEALGLAKDLEDPVALVHIHQGFGAVFQDREEYGLGLEYYRRGLVIANLLGYRIGQFELIWRMGELQLRMRDYGKAEQLASTAVRLAGDINDQNYSYLALTLRAKAYLATRRLEEARDDLLQAIAIADLLRSQAGGQRLQAVYVFERKIEPFYLMVDLLARQNKGEEALLSAEQARSQELLQLIGGDRLDIGKAMTVVEKEEEGKLNGQLTSLNSQFYRESQRKPPDQGQIAELGAKIQKARFELDAFLDKLYVNHPALRVTLPRTALSSMTDLNTVLVSSDTAILEFEVLDDYAYLFAVTRTPTSSPRVQAYRIDIDRKTLSNQVREFRDRITTGSLGVDRLSAELYRVLLGPALAELAGKNTLIIIPDGILWDLPFQALQEPDGRYVIENHPIYAAPSLTVLKAMMKERSASQELKQAQSALEGIREPTANLLVAFGNPKLSQETVERAKATERNESLQPLPDAEREVELLAHLYGSSRSQVFVGAAATEERAKSEMSRFHILHFATHGILDAKDPLYSHIVLAQENGTKEDGLLEAREILNMNLNADLVVLSACQTARGRVSTGEGVIGMAWSFFAAGCPTAVVSQWNVDSRATQRLMVLFHRNLLKRISSSGTVQGSAQSLRDAVLEIMKDVKFRHPYYWASFVVVGDGR